MRFGLYLGNQGEAAEPRRFAEAAARAERAGWDGVFTWDHLSGKRPSYDPFVQLALAAAATERVTLGVLVAALPRWGPWRIALAAGSLAAAAPGRVVLGVGAGSPRDLARVGDEGGSPGARLDEALPLVRRLLAGEAVTHHGTHYALEELRAAPGELAVWVGGDWPRRPPFRGIELADGVVPSKRGADGFEALTVDEVAELRAAVPANVRDVAVWAGGGEQLTEEGARAYADAGATWWIVDGPRAGAPPLRA